MLQPVFSITLFLSLLCCSWACSPPADSVPSPTAAARSAALVSSVDTLDYWNQGKAEINRYELRQNRYADQHPGEVVLIFVKEDFLTDLQVKNDRYRNPNSKPVLKTNQLRRFTTGLYDYSIMTSVFTPMDRTPTLKVSLSAQDWCGQSFAQLNYRDEAYRHQLFSYFESEGDVTDTAKADWLEDELFNRVRLLGADVPTGTFTLIPSLTYLRLRHKPYAPYRADISLAPYRGSDFSGTDLLEYAISFPELDKETRIVFEKAAPHRIVGFTETYPSAFDGQPRRTIATLTDSLFEAYWDQNAAEDTVFRQRLGL
jgi:hypothetical protein